VANLFEVQGFGALSEWNGQFASTSAAQAFQQIAALGSNSVSLTARIWTTHKTTNDVFAHPGKTESDASLLAGFKAAEAAGLSVVFKAGISPLDGTGVSSLAPTDIGAFFASYKAEIMHLAGIAQQGGVDTFAIGNEMSSLTASAYRSYWTDIISSVRQVYHGQLTYSAATDEALKVSFWDQVDIIGVNTYPPLTSSATPTVREMIDAWTEIPYNPYYAAAFDYKSPAEFLHSLSETYGKQVLMTEAGFRSMDGTAMRPGSWTVSAPADTAEQADAYNAFFQVWSAHGGSWMKGVELWQWDLNGKYNETGYSPMGKPAEAIVAQYFHGNGASINLSVTGSPISDVIDLGRGDDTINAGLGNDVIYGGDGNDGMIGGPSMDGTLATTTVTLTGYGTAVGGVNAQVQVLVNGQPVSAVFEFKPSADPAGYQTYAVTFANPEQLTSLDISLMNAAPGRALHLKDLVINGVSVAPKEAINAGSPGSFDLYVRYIHVDAARHQDWFIGASSDHDLIYGGAGNDVITGGIGNDVIDGGDGIDTAVFSGKASDYKISVVNGQLVVIDSVAARDGIDRISKVESFKFADATISTAGFLASQSAVAKGGEYQAVTSNGTTVTSETIRNVDGSRDVYTRDIAGKTYVSEHTVIGAGGKTTLIERFYSDGDLGFRQVTNGDGSVSRSDFDGDGHMTSLLKSFAGGSFQQFAFNAAGFETNETVRNVDGTRDIRDYGLTGQEYTSRHTVQDAAGKSVLIEAFHSDGTLAMKQKVDAAGTKTSSQYDQLGHLSQQTETKADGSFVQTGYKADGDVASLTIRSADGTRDAMTYDIAGKAYTTEHVIRDAAGKSVLIEQFHQDGSLALQQTVDASGIKMLAQYDATGHLATQTLAHIDGSSVQSTFAVNGALTAVTTRNVDGSKSVYTFGVTDQAYTSRHDVFDTGGQRLATTFDNRDGSQTQAAYKAGATLTSTVGNDIMNSAGGDTFVFKQASGHDTINNFRVAEGASHDVIEIDSSIAKSLSELAIHVVGHDTIIELGHDASIMLKGVVAPLTSHEVLIV
jgi:Ca2+-binding RTX toxin-like protein